MKKKAILFDYVKVCLMLYHLIQKDSYYVLYPDKETSDIKDVKIQKNFALCLSGNFF